MYLFKVPGHKRSLAILLFVGSANTDPVHAHKTEMEAPAAITAHDELANKSGLFSPSQSIYNGTSEATLPS